MPEPAPKKKSEKRARTERFYVRVTKEEKALIEKKAATTSKHPCTYLRDLGTGKRIKTTIDSEAIFELGQLKSELGRLGGLVKAWLSPKQKNIGTTPESKKYLANNKPVLKELLMDLNLIASKIEDKVKKI